MPSLTTLFAIWIGQAELTLKSSELDDAKECITTYEHEVLQLNLNLDILNDKYTNRESSIAHSMERIAQASSVTFGFPYSFRTVMMDA